MTPCILFKSSSGNTALATLEFGPNNSGAVRIEWEETESVRDRQEFETALPEALASIGITLECTPESRCCQTAEQMESEVRRYFANQNTN